VALACGTFLWPPLAAQIIVHNDYTPLITPYYIFISGGQRQGADRKKEKNGCFQQKRSANELQVFISFLIGAAASEARSFCY
jgi:hypothetical protein